jgi:hypothetical protein
VIYCLVLLAFFAVAVAESFANKLRWSSTFEQRVHGRADTSETHINPCRNYLVDFDRVAQRNKQIEHTSERDMWNDHFSRRHIVDNHVFRVARTLGIVASLGIVGAIVGVFLVRYRSRRSKVHWKITLLETVVIVTITVVVSLLVSGSAEFLCRSFESVTNVVYVQLLD